eukprot:4536839-Lingulodinium_polyedra.AAC.1
MGRAPWQDPWASCAQDTHGMKPLSWAPWQDPWTSGAQDEPLQMPRRPGGMSFLGRPWALLCRISTAP